LSGATNCDFSMLKSSISMYVVLSNTVAVTFAGRLVGVEEL
jgi:hypothetical protein